jgi:hypothetical protein
MGEVPRYLNKSRVEQRPFSKELEGVFSVDSVPEEEEGTEARGVKQEPP